MAAVISTARADTAEPVALRGPRGDERWTLTRCRMEDAPDVAELYGAMSDESRRWRFFQAVPRVPMSTVRWLCDVDQVRHRAWLARSGADGREVLGEVRGVIDEARTGEDTEAELAVAVRDDWSGRGLGRAMVLHLLAELAEAGVTSARCEVLADNRRSIGLFQSIGFRFRLDGGVLVGRMPIGAPTAAPLR